MSAEQGEHVGEACPLDLQLGFKPALESCSVARGIRRQRRPGESTLEGLVVDVIDSVFWRDATATGARFGQRARIVSSVGIETLALGHVEEVLPGEDVADRAGGEGAAPSENTLDTVSVLEDVEGKFQAWKRHDFCRGQVPTMFSVY